MTTSTQNTVLQPIGSVSVSAPSEFFLQIDTDYRAALQGLDTFSHINVLWLSDQPASNSDGPDLLISDPYVGGPAEVGLFTTRSPARPNRLGLSVCEVVSVDETVGVVSLTWIDAYPDTPVLDIKPYFPSSDRVQNARVPDWCSRWPNSLEESASFDWESVFN